MGRNEYQPVSALETLRQIASGRLDASAAAAERRARITEAEAGVQAFSALSNSAAQNTSGPLSGLSCAVKDIFDTYDMPTEYGSSIYRGHQPMWDASVVTRLRALGADVIGKSVSTEFAYFSPGPTRNPSDLTRTPGGSSSGSAAAVAAGFAHAALGSQTVGSILRPASYCGVAGYKPNFGLLPTIGVKPFATSLDTVGLFAKTVADIAYVAEAVAGRSLRVDQAENRPQPRIGLYRTHFWDEASRDMQAAVIAAAERAKEAGATVIDVDPTEELVAADTAHAVIFCFEAAEALADELIRHRERLSPVLCDLLDTGAATSIEDLDDARAAAKRGRLYLVDLFKQVDVLLTPSAPGVAPEGITATGTPQFNRLWTLLGTPCISVPGLTSPNGMPLGIQLVGAAGSDARTLAAAAWMETLLRK